MENIFNVFTYLLLKCASSIWVLDSQKFLYVFVSRSVLGLAKSNSELQQADPQTN